MRWKTELQPRWKRFFALVPHLCVKCLHRLWLEGGFMELVGDCGTDSIVIANYQCQDCWTKG